MFYDIGPMAKNKGSTLSTECVCPRKVVNTLLCPRKVVIFAGKAESLPKACIIRICL